MAKLERKTKRVHQENIRLNKFLATAGVGSRRGNDKLIASGAVTVNGETVMELGTKVDPSRDKIFVHGQQIVLQDRLVYVVLNKPKDAITTVSDEKKRTTVMNYVRVKERIYPVGRLDRNTTGVLLFTNDGEFAHALMHPRFEIERAYRVTLDKSMVQPDLARLRKGVRLADGLAKPQSAEIIDGSGRKKVLVVLREGRNREVRRMFEAIGYDVRQLDRVSYAGITPLGLTRGEWRHLTKQEVEYLKQQAGIN
ncbi:MAG: rRNA pseudouridine synthase [Ignavibacteriales bacterium]|nr:rRNA pseudouridine synthase [Ignavibacteriales bacterium]